MSTQPQDDSPYDRPDDLRRIAAFVRARPSARRQVVDLPYRLASPAVQDPANRRLWTDGHGAVHAYALAQTPMWTLDYALAPRWAGAELEREVLAWGVARWRAIAASGGPGMIFVDVPVGDTDRQALLGALGFARHAWYQMRLSQPLPAAIPPGEIPAGFTIRPLAGAAEVEGYVALHRAAFGSENMTVDWRRRTLAAPEYRADLDLVAEAADGRLAGFCIGWLAMVDGRTEAQIEPLGVRPDVQGRGLGRALIGAALHQFQTAGAERAHIEVDADNAAALALYTRAGFRPAQTFLKYGKQM